jgi:hypothetical protein
MDTTPVQMTDEDKVRFAVEIPQVRRDRAARRPNFFKKVGVASVIGFSMLCSTTTVGAVIKNSIDDLRTIDDNAYSAAEVKSLEDQCYSATVPKTSTASIVVNDNTLSVRKDMPEVRVMGVDEHLIIPDGVKVGKVMLCGAGVEMVVSGEADEVFVHGAHAALFAAYDGAVHGGVVRGADCFVNKHVADYVDRGECKVGKS